MEQHTTFTMTWRFVEQGSEWRIYFVFGKTVVNVLPLVKAIVSRRSFRLNGDLDVIAARFSRKPLSTVHPWFTTTRSSSIDAPLLDRTAASVRILGCVRLTPTLFPTVGLRNRGPASVGDQVVGVSMPVE